MTEDEKSDPSYTKWLRTLYEGSQNRGDSYAKSAGILVTAAGMKGVQDAYQTAYNAAGTVNEVLSGDDEDIEETAEVLSGDD